MTIKKVGFVGWRGMVGSVLLQRMLAEDDFAIITEPVFFSTSAVGGTGPSIKQPIPPLQDAFAIDALKAMDVIVSCQGSDYTRRVLPALRSAAWQGYWIDAASYLRMEDDTIIVLDPVNREAIETALVKGIKNFAGANCTVSLMMMAMQGLLQAGMVEWISSMTYQAASGAGARVVREWLTQIHTASSTLAPLLEDPASQLLAIDAQLSQTLRSDRLPTEQIGAPLAGNVLPWIDTAVDHGQTREEWKGQAETNKILDRTERPIAVDGLCVRVGAMRCHSQALTVKLTQDIGINTISTLLTDANHSVTVVPNERAATLAQLTPVAVASTLNIAVGRLRKMSLGPRYLSVFTVGDQLLWGAAESLRRMLRILLDEH